MMSLDVIEGYVDVPFLQLGVVLQVLEDFWHHFVTEVRITENFKGRYVRPEEVSVCVVHIMRTLRGGKKTFKVKVKMVNVSLIMVISFLVSKTYFIAFLSLPRRSATATINIGIKPSGKNSGPRFVSTLTVGIFYFEDLK